MRSRPGVRLLLRPPRALAGDTLIARVELEVGSETPCAGVDVVLRGQESRYKSTTGADPPTSDTYEREVIAVGARFEPGVLRPGTWSRDVAFALPRDAPPSYVSALTTIAYEVEVRVVIPWWLDQEARFVAVVHPTPEECGVEPVVFTSQHGDHRGEEPVLELSLEDRTLRRGETLTGAVALTGLRGKRVRRIELACCTLECALAESDIPVREVDRRVWTLTTESPAEGEAVRFNVRVPADVSAGFRTRFVRVEHRLEVHAVIALGRDVVITVPVRVIAPVLGATRARSATAPVGRVRTAAVWNQAIEHFRHQGAELLRAEAAQGTVTFAQGGVVGLVREEAQGPRGPRLVAELEYDSLGLGLRLAPRSWTDLGRGASGLDAGFSERFTVQGREAAQLVAMFDAGLRTALLGFDEAVMDDQRAVVCSDGGVYQVTGLQRFFIMARALAARLGESARRVPPPAALRGDWPAWEGFAQRHGLRLRPGDGAALGWSMNGVPLRLEHAWEEAVPTHTLLVAELPESIDPSAWREAFERELGAVIVTSARGLGLRLSRVRDPESVRATAQRFTEAVRARLSNKGAAPYR